MQPDTHTIPRPPEERTSPMRTLYISIYESCGRSVSGGPSEIMDQ